MQDSLSHRLHASNPGIENRGVKRAPFVVLIGANMPSILAEISFLSNPTDERLLRATPERQRVAEGLFKGVESYLANLNSLAVNLQGAASGDETQVVSVRNKK